MKKIAVYEEKLLESREPPTRNSAETNEIIPIDSWETTIQKLLNCEKIRGRTSLTTRFTHIKITLNLENFEVRIGNKCTMTHAT